MPPGHENSPNGGGSGLDPEPRTSEAYVQRLQRELREGRADLKERVKELKCLFSVDRALRQANGESWHAVLQEVVDALPSGFQFPERMAARVRVGTRSFTTPGYASSEWTLARSVALEDERLCEVEVCFVGAPPGDAPGDPFLEEEERLMKAVVDRLREALWRRRVEHRLRRAEAFQRALIEASPVGLFSMDSEGRVLSWNPAAEDIFGWAAGEVMGRFLPLVPEDDLERFREIRRQVMEGRSLSDIRLERRRRDGAPIQISLSVAPVREEDGTVRAIMAVAEDVTERKEAWERVRFQSDLLEAVGQAVIATDAGGTVTFWNQKAEELYGWSEQEALGRHIMELTPAVLESPRRKAEEVMERLGRGEGWTGEIELQRRDGSTFPALVTNSPVLDEAGELTGIIGVSSDISDVKELESRLHRSQKMEAVGRLAGGVAHDFNNLLTVIQGHTHLVQDELPSDSPLQEGMEAIANEVNRAVRLTRQLLTFSRRQIMDARPMDLTEVAEGMQSMLRRLIPSRIEMEFEAPDEPLMVLADPSKIEQVVLNLAVNAADAIQGSGRIQIRVDEHRVDPDLAEAARSVVEPGRYARIEVVDTGSGIPEEHLDQIFDPFFTTKAEGEGTGLGLSTVFGVVKQSGGHVTVDTEVGEGTTFRVILPLLDQEVAEASAVDAGHDRAVRTRHRTPPGRGATILLVEDTAGVRDVAVRALERGGHTVLSTSDGYTALELLERHTGELDLVITDVVMPELGGVGLLERLEESRPDLPVILMSGHSDRELGSDLRSRAAGFLTKPFTPQELVRVAESTLRG